MGKVRTICRRCHKRAILLRGVCKTCEKQAGHYKREVERQEAIMRRLGWIR